MGSTLHLLCAGAAQGLVKALQDRFAAEAGAELQARFGAVGAMKDALIAGEPCDLMIVTDAMVSTLSDEGLLRGETRASIGSVRTGIAVHSGHALPDVSTPEALKAALLAADAIYFPDPVRATAGIHFAQVMRDLGIHDILQRRFRNFPNGATSMRELAGTDTARPIGCTQVTEIRYTPGVSLVAPLPPPFELATVYTAALSARSAEPALAERFIALLTGPASASLRTAAGFDS